MYVKTTLMTVITRIMLASLIIFMISIGMRFITRQIIIEHLSIDNLFTQAVMFDTEILKNKVKTKSDEIQSVNIDWTSDYPFDNADKNNKTGNIESNNILKTIKRYSSNIKEIVFAIESNIEKYTTDYIIFYDIMVENASSYNKVLDWELNKFDEYNSIITLKDGYLAGCYDLYNVEPIINSFNVLNDFLSESGVSLLYVQTPCKVCREDTEVDGVLDFSNKNADNLLLGLNKLGISYLDLREILHEEGHNHHSMFYYTDHHWKAETGLWAAEKISSYLNEHLGFNINTGLFSADNYTFDIYKDWFLGSQGRKVTLAGADPEDISLIYPDFKTDISMKIPSLSIDKTGDFSIIYNYSEIETKDFYNNNPYRAYFYADSALTSVHNNLINDGSKVLVISDSFKRCMSPFLSLGVEQLDTMDMRYFNGSLQTYIKNNLYDAIIIMYSPGMFDDTEAPVWRFE